MRALNDDGKAKKTLGKSPATFLGNFFPKLLARTSSSIRIEAPKSGGADFTRPNEGAKFKRALDNARNAEALEDAVTLIKDKFFAESNKGQQARKEADVLELAATLAKGTSPFPLTPQRVVEFGAALKGADYKSGEQYLGALRLAHMERDHPVTPALKRAFDLTRRALIRDKGKANRAPEFQIEEFGDDVNEHDLVDDALAFPALTYSLAVAFMLRRCELEKLRWEDVHLAPDSTQVTLHIKESKNDQQGQGVKRTLGCTCRSSPATCPVECVKKLKERFLKAGLLEPKQEKTWITSTTQGNRAVKSQIVTAWQRAAGRPLQGHSARRSGTMFYVRAGLTIAEVTYFGRWHSDLVFQYGEEAWETRPANYGTMAHPRAIGVAQEASRREGQCPQRAHRTHDRPHLYQQLADHLHRRSPSKSAQMDQGVGPLQSGPPPRRWNRFVRYVEDQMRLDLCKSLPLHPHGAATTGNPKLREMQAEYQWDPRQAK